jgi:hypothetical protein
MFLLFPGKIKLSSLGARCAMEFGAMKQWDWPSGATFKDKSEDLKRQTKRVPCCQTSIWTVAAFLIRRQLNRWKHLTNWHYFSPKHSKARLHDWRHNCETALTECCECCDWYRQPGQLQKLQSFVTRWSIALMHLTEGMKTQVWEGEK